jgi:glyceraldehyde 3-phosphate dehydrogenase
VPVTNVSLVDLTVRLATPVKTKDELMAPFRLAAERDPAAGLLDGSVALRGVLGVSDEKLVSSDYLSSKESSIIDVDASVMLDERTAKIVAWYDNEYGFSSRSEFEGGVRARVVADERQCVIWSSTWTSLSGRRDGTIPSEGHDG